MYVWMNVHIYYVCQQDLLSKFSMYECMNVCMSLCIQSLVTIFACCSRILTISISLSVSFFVKGDSWDAHEPVFLAQPLHLPGAGGAQALGRWWHGRNFSESEVQFGRPRRVGEVEHEVRLPSWICNRTTVVVLQVFCLFVCLFDTILRHSVLYVGCTWKTSTLLKWPTLIYRYIHWGSVYRRSLKPPYSDKR